jgi:predicted aconitase with swiveling domain
MHFCGEYGRGNIDAAVLLTQMKTLGAIPQGIVENRREKMLSAMLLHMIEAARPIEDAEGRISL